MDKTNRLTYFSVHPDLQNERQKASFDPESITIILDGGRDNTDNRRRLQEMVLVDKVLSDGLEYPFLSESKKYELALKKMGRFVDKCKELGIENDILAASVFRHMAFPFDHPPMNVHLGMFVKTLEYQGSEEQKKKWLGLRKHVIGTYAQTELGHGTHLRGIETTAKYDQVKQEFILNSPNLTSIKWWPAGLGNTCNYALVMATLIVNGRNCGMQPFVVQIRDMNSHTPLPGISVGNIGPKLGMHSTDNGFLKLDHVRIPRDHMLMKNAVVERDGTFREVKNRKLTYGTMVFIRAGIVSQAYLQLAAASTIATRYSCIRRQSELEPGQGEPQVLDYQTQQYKIFPAIAASYAFCFTAHKIMNIFLNHIGDIQQGDVTFLPELHALTAGLKAFTTNVTMWGVEQCRLACGGHGYSQACGISKIYGAATPGCTYEGENTVLLLQSGRFLLRVCEQMRQGETPKGSVAYLLAQGGNLGVPVSGKRIEPKLDILIKAYQHRARRIIWSTFKSYEDGLAKGKKDWEMRNTLGVSLLRAANVHCHSWIMENFAQTVKKMETNNATANVLTLLCQFYGVYGIIEQAGDFLEDDYFTLSDVNSLRNKLLELFDAIRPEAVALVDAFDLPDHLLGSVLGRYDGRVYENLYTWVQKSSINATDVHHSFHKYLKPLRKEFTTSKL